MSADTISSEAGGTLVAMYHYVREAAAGAGLNALDPADFDRQLAWIARRRKVVPYAAVEAALGAHARLDGTALLTFDDGFVDHYETVFPRLRARGHSGIFFLIGAALATPPRMANVHKTHALVAALGAPAFADAVRRAIAHQPAAAGVGLAKRAEVYRYDGAADESAVKHLLNYELPHEIADRVLDGLFAEHLGDEAVASASLYLSAGMIREMAAAGMTFGFHTERHRVLSRLTRTEQHAEVAPGIARVRALTGQRSVPFCYPYGHSHTYDADTVSVLAEAGYSAAFNTVRRLADTASDQRFDLPRYDTRDLPPFAGVPHA